MFVKYSKVHDKALTPKRENPSDAGLDVFYSPENELQDIIIQPHKSFAIPTGLSFEVPHGYMLKVENRSGVSLKEGLAVGGGVIDAGYSGEVKVIIHNLRDEVCVLKPGKKIAQLVMYPVLLFDTIEVEKEELYDRDIIISKRGSAGFGSSDKK